MATNKRRKLETSHPPQLMSAAAARKRLLEKSVQNALSEAPSEAPIEDSDKLLSDSNETITTTENEGAKSDVTVRSRNGRPKRDTKVSSTSRNSTNKVNLNGDVGIEVISARRTSTVSTREYVELPDAVQLSTFRPTKSNYHRKPGGNVRLKLADGERLIIVGTYGLRVTRGEVTIAGAVLRQSENFQWVNAPRCHALPVIRCSEESDIELSANRATRGLRELEKVSPLFKKLWVCDQVLSTLAAPKSSDNDEFWIVEEPPDEPKRVALCPLLSPPEWNRKIATHFSTNSTKPASIMVTGPKSSGKSTFGRILANRLVTNISRGSTRTKRSTGVAILDLDPGQPEFAAPGQISLVRLSEPNLSPSFCRPLSSSGAQMLRSHTLAGMSPASDPDLFLECAVDLYTHYQNTQRSCPLIINTPGWVQGTGLDILVNLIEILRPSEILYMSLTGPAEAVGALEQASGNIPFTTLPSQASQYTTRTPAHLRTMQTMSYFHAQHGKASTGSKQDESSSAWNSAPLTSMPPWEVTFSGQNQGVFGVMCYDYNSPPDLLADLINGQVLAVVEIENHGAFRTLGGLETGAINQTAAGMEIDEDSSRQASRSALEGLGRNLITRTPEGIPLIRGTSGSTLDPKHSHTIGLALVRGIDTKKQTLQLLTPITLEKFQEISSHGRAIVLLSGKFDPAGWAYTEDLFYRSYGENGEMDGDAEPEELLEYDSDTSGSRVDEEEVSASASSTQTPWVEILQGNQKRGVGSRVWRVRRDLGRSTRQE